MTTDVPTVKTSAHIPDRPAADRASPEIPIFGNSARLFFQSLETCGAMTSNDWNFRLK
jgi:hypothetical protein